MPDFVDGLQKLGIEVNNRQKAALRRIGGPKLFDSLSKIAGDDDGVPRRSREEESTSSRNVISSRTRFDEHNVFNRQVGRVIDHATRFDHGTSTGGYFDANGNALLRIPRCDVVDHLDTKQPKRHKGKRRATSAEREEMTREECRQRDCDRYSQGWAKNLDSHVPLGNGEVKSVSNGLSPFFSLSLSKK